MSCCFCVSIEQHFSTDRSFLFRQVDGGDALTLVEMSTLNDGTVRPDSVPLVVVGSSEAENHEEKKTISSWDSTTGGTDQLSLSIIEQSFDGGIGEFDLPIAKSAVQGRRLIPRENPRDMIIRWELDNLDLKTVVEDALSSGRIPLAVLQLHLQHQREMVTEEKPHDSFGEVCDIGRAIAYDLFLKVSYISFYKWIIDFNYPILRMYI